jgi:indole-3-glycerol phosphate synthase
MILDDIIANKRMELARWQRERPLENLKRDVLTAPPVRNFTQALLPPDVGATRIFRVIAEVKKASPSKGVLREDFDPVKIAATYQSCGAAAISVLTDRNYFQGDLEYLKQVREATVVPLLMKDFIIDPYQLYQARMHGADAVLLIAAILSAGRLSRFLGLAAGLGLSSLVEVHSRDDLKKALAADALIIGINNRDLKTFEVSVETTRRLAPLVGPGKIIVSESGIHSKEVMASLVRQGVHAFLIGEALMRAEDMGSALRSLLN